MRHIMKETVFLVVLFNLFFIVCQMSEIHVDIIGIYYSEIQSTREIIF